MVQGKQSVTKEEIVKFMMKSDDPVWVTSEIADEFNVSDVTARSYLYELAEDGAIRMKKPGARTVIWWAKNQSKSVASA